MLATAKTKMIVMPAKRMFSAISLGVFCRSAPSTSPIMRSRKVEPWAAVMRTTIQSEITMRAAGHGRAVAARFADDRRGFAGNGGFVHRGNAFDHVAVRRDEIARLDEDDVAGLQLYGRHLRELAVVARIGELLGDHIGLGRAKACGLRFAAPLGHGFREVREQNREPEP